MTAGEGVVRVITSPAGKVLVVVGLGYALWRFVLRDKLAAAAALVDPTSTSNLAYRGASSAVGAVTGNASLGSSIFDGVEAVRDLFGAGIETDWVRQGASNVNNQLPGLPGTKP